MLDGSVEDVVVTETERTYAQTSAADPSMTDTGLGGSDARQDADGGTDVTLSWEGPRAAWRKLAVIAAAIIVVLGLAAWQFVSLSLEVAHLQRVERSYAKMLAAEERQLSRLHTSVSAAIGCLANSQSQPDICTRFLP